MRPDAYHREYVIVTIIAFKLNGNMNTGNNINNKIILVAKNNWLSQHTA